MVAVLIALVVLAAFYGVLLFKNHSDTKPESEGNMIDTQEEKVESNDSINTPKEFSTKPSGVVIIMAGVMLTLSIVGSIVCFVACGKAEDDTLQIVLGAIGGYNLLQGIILFTIMFGIGHILKNNEEMNEKMDKLLEK